MAKLQPRIGVGALSNSLEVGAERAPAACEQLAALLRTHGCEVVDLGTVGTPDESVAAGRFLAESRVDAVALSPACWFEDYLALDLLEECAAPLLLWPLPGMETGALCGTQQLTCYLKQLGHSYKAVFGELDDEGCFASASPFLRGAALQNRLRRARIGVAGPHVGGMTHTAPAEMALKKVVGPRIVGLDLPQVLARAEEMPNATAREAWRALQKRVGNCEVSDDAGIDSMRVYAAVRELVDDHRLDALTIGCYPQLMGRVCLAASLLADEGIPLACEGDAHGAVGQLICSLLTDAPTHNTDWLDPLDEDSVVFTHCGAGSLSLAESPSDIKIGSVRLMGQGACALFTAKPGPVTMLSLSVNGAGYQCALLEGEAISTEMVFPGNPLRVQFDRPVAELHEWIFAEGIAHHWMVGYGHVGADIRAWAEICGQGLTVLSPRPESETQELGR